MDLTAKGGLYAHLYETQFTETEVNSEGQ